jgi:hypothetical protein
MKWHGKFFAYYYGKKKVNLREPDHIMNPCLPPEKFFEQLYRGAGGYRKTHDWVSDNRRVVIFESDSGEWHLFGERHPA